MCPSKTEISENHHKGIKSLATSGERYKYNMARFIRYDKESASFQKAI
jgi:hypothetical protein